MVQLDTKTLKLHPIREFRLRIRGGQKNISTHNGSPGFVLCIFYFSLFISLFNRCVVLVRVRRKRYESFVLLQNRCTLKIGRINDGNFKDIIYFFFFFFVVQFSNILFDKITKSCR